MICRVFLLLLLTCHLIPCWGQTEPLPPILAARKGFETKLLKQQAMGEAAEVPPSGVLSLVTYAAPLGANAAYIGPDPKDGKKHPAIIWLVGGFSNSIGDFAWNPGPRKNDQSAAGFRDAGIVMMYPSLRGGNDSPGFIETFYGEVDDVLAAAKYLASLDYVDPRRIYLGGHSTGGTLALLVAAASGDRFRAVFSLGPVEDVVGYGSEVLPFDLDNQKEGYLRAPRVWLKNIRCPTLIFEGTEPPSNFSSLLALKKSCTNAEVQFFPMKDETHFSAIVPVIDKLVARIQSDASTSTEPKP